jgi:hypothetical protein
MRRARANQRYFVLRSMLLARGLRQVDLAKRLKCSPQFVCQLISGARRSRTKEGQICQLIGIPRGDLFH